MWYYKYTTKYKEGFTSNFLFFKYKEWKKNVCSLKHTLDQGFACFLFLCIIRS